jgi:glycosyltransferase involved in cell wall biosynthesis
MTLHIGITGPVASADIRHLLDDPAAALPRGYEGAPLMGTLISELLRRGHRVSAVTLSSDMPLDSDTAQRVRGPRFDLHFVPMRPRAWPFNGWRPGRIVDLYAFERAGLRRAIDAAGPDVVHAHWSYEFAWAALRTGLPHVVTCHDSPLVIARFQRDFRHGAYRWLRAGVAWHVLRQARHVTTVSPYMAEQLCGLCRAPVHVVANPVASALFTRPRGDAGKAPAVVMVGNGWDTRKNGEAGLRAFARVSAELPETELHAFGSGFGPGEAAQAFWLRQGNRGRVHFHGAVPHEALLAAMSRSQALLHPALEESFGVVLAEAMALGVPVVAGANSGAVPWVLGDAGWLVDVRQPAQIAAALLRVLGDPVRAEAMATRGRQLCRDRFSAEAVADAYERHYEAALRSPTAAREALA